MKEDLKETGNSWDDVRREALNRLGWKRSVRTKLATGDFLLR